MAETRDLFATPFVIDRLQSEAGLAMLREAVEAEMARDAQGVSISNVGGWHSNTQMLEWGGEAARALAYKAMTMADAHTLDTKSPQESRFGWIPEMWANVSRKGHSNQYHTHPGSFWSAVAYLDDGYEGDEDTELGGELQLLDPRMPMNAMTAPDLRRLGANGRHTPREPTIRPQTGMIVMFPSWLQHAVRAFHGEGKRISIAINLTAALKKQD
ncbi:2OG-Fe(II) oxygenase family protein [Aurantiacibacter poecillastricola]|uniref:2OG-Fe(II) oxygenase family protein n=1 Tax=Aurantiacibacter poecillastricola TaxID=3064385 RepID=UPI00273E0E02|nr:2OG-Fe(II) oxygenase family protein [Aurantiacibacter sp. 219JJ12-13]MDP5261874.1 2OG-Fe(II) oxygenase family protein [Aurantiacibacter sp. 219JJ12-13]